MGQTIILTGMVLSAQPIGEYDKRITLLTKERGKISAFAKGARRQNSSLLAAANPFSFGEFEAFIGRSAYTIVKCNISNYFRELTEDMERAYYGFYLLEIAEYITQENNDEIHMLKLLYQTFRALINDKIDNRLIRCIFELKTMVINGEYPNVYSCQNCGGMEMPAGFHAASRGIVCSTCQKKMKIKKTMAKKNSMEFIEMNGSILYTMQYIISSTIEKLYTFTVSPEVLATMEQIMKEYMKVFLKKEFRSLQVLEENKGFTDLAVEIHNKKRYNN